MSLCGSFNKMFHFYPSFFPVVTPPFPQTSPSRRAAALQSVTRTDEARLHLTALSAERVRRGRSLNTTPVL